MTNSIQQSIYDIVASIPKGKVMTYGQIAKKLHLKTPRIVGYYLHKNTDPKKVPCHRVVFSNGRLSKAYAFGGEEGQRKKLVQENVRFLSSFTVKVSP